MRLTIKTFIVIVSLLIILSVQLHALDIPTPRTTHQVVGSHQVKLAVQEWGVPTGKPILFLHAWSQSHLGWLPQIQSDLAQQYRLITVDLRGHGNSEKPLDKTQYNNADVWAGDLNAVITHLALEDVVLVGWSYGTLVIADYIKKYGQTKVAAINFVGGTSGLGVDRVSQYFGTDAEASMQAFDATLPTQALGMVAVANMMVPDNLDKALYGFLIATNMVVPPLVRQAMVARQIDHQATYESLTVPVLFTHGEQDTGVLPIAAREGVTFVQNGQLSLYPAANHGPQWYDPKRFNQELAALVEKATAN